MKLLYMGTPEFAVKPLRSLVDAGHEVAGVVTRADKPSGRGRVITPPPVKLAAAGMGFTVYQPKRVREQEFIQALRGLDLDAVVVAAYGQILPKEILSLPRRGCINVHASLLPRYRGAAPINWAIIKGDEATGITIMQMDEGMDTGAILLQEAIHIDPLDTAGTLTEKLSELGARLITQALRLIVSGGIAPREQDHSKATAAPMLKKEDGLIEWRLTANDIHNRVRGLSPWPGAYGFVDGKLIKIMETRVIPGRGEPGMIYTDGQEELKAGTGNGMLRITRLQAEGRKPVTAGEFLRGHRGISGKKFAAANSKSEARNSK